MSQEEKKDLIKKLKRKINSTALKVAMTALSVTGGVAGAQAQASNGGDSGGKPATEQRMFSIRVKSTDEKVLEDGVREGDENRFYIGTISNNVSDQTNTQPKVLYSFNDEGKPIIHNRAELRPDISQIKLGNNSVVLLSDGRIRCGGTIGSDRHMQRQVIRAEKQAREELAYDFFVYQDLSKREQGGAKLGKVEKEFMKQYCDAVKAHGLKIGKNGLQQQTQPQVTKEMHGNSGR